MRTSSGRIGALSFHRVAGSCDWDDGSVLRREVSESDWLVCRYPCDITCGGVYVGVVVGAVACSSCPCDGVQ